VSSESELPGLLHAPPSAGVVNFDEDHTSTKTSNNNSSSSVLQKNEVVDTPSQLCQYSMLVTCKLRLAALLCFLRTHTHQKVVVFFATCDSVDFHSLLFRETQWPQEMDAAVDRPQDSEAGAESVDASMDEFIAKTSLNSSSVGLMKNASNYLQPLSQQFTGIFGTDCPMFRLHGNVPHKVST
jgi:hypothetical protein